MGGTDAERAGQVLHRSLAVATGNLHVDALRVQRCDRGTCAAADAFADHETCAGLGPIAQPQRTVVVRAGGEAGLPQPPALAGDVALDTAARMLDHGIGGHAAGRCVRGEHLGEWMGAAGFQRRGDVQCLRGAEPIEAGGIHGAFGQAERAGLVEHQGVDLGQPAQRIGTQRQHAQPGQRAIGSGQRCRHRQRQRARATDHQQGQGDFNGPRGIVHAPAEVHRHGDDAQAQHEPARDPIRGLCQRRPVRLRLFNQRGQLRQPGRASGGTDAHARGACIAQGACVDRIARMLAQGRGFTGEQGFGEGRLRIQQHAIRGHGLATGNADHIAHRKGRNRHAFLSANRSFATGEGGLRACQRVHLGAGHVAHPLFQHARCQQQEHEHHCRVVPDVGAAAHGFEGACAPGQQDGTRDQRVHAGATVAQFAHGAGEERPTCVEHHRRADQEGDPAQEVAQRQRHLPARVQVQRLGEHHRLHRPKTGDPGPQQPAVALAAPLALAGLAGGQERPVAQRLQAPQRTRQWRARRVPGDADAAGHRVRADFQHACLAAQGPVDQPGAGCAAHPIGEQG